MTTDKPPNSKRSILIAWVHLILWLAFAWLDWYAWQFSGFWGFLADIIWLGGAPSIGLELFRGYRGDKKKETEPDK